MKLDRQHEIALQQGKILGRPEGSVYKQAIYEMRCKGYKQREVANYFNISLSTVKRYWKKDYSNSTNYRVIIYQPIQYWWGIIDIIDVGKVIYITNNTT